MALVFKKRPPAPAVEEALVDGALKPKGEKVRTNAAILEDWRKFVGPNAKPIACAYCGHLYYLPCKGEEHAGCQNFHAKQRNSKGKPNV